MLILLVSCLFSCRAQNHLAGEKMEDLVLVAQDEYSGFSEFGTMVIRDTKSLNKFYSQINKTRKPGLPVPMIDFSKEMAIVVCLPEQSGGSEPMLSKIDESESELNIAIKLKGLKTTENEGNTSLVNPFYVYKMPLATKTINLKKEGW